ncbi:MAG: hydrogenase maturation protease [Phototrophicaceae bacterium]
MILILGYGNPLRSDDGVGQVLAEALAPRLSDLSVEVQALYQLLPELAEPISRAEWVIFIDARAGNSPATLHVEAVTPLDDVSAFTHHVSPGGLLGAAREFYGHAPNGLLLSIEAADFALGTALSAVMAAALPRLVAQIEAEIRAIAYGRG